MIENIFNIPISSNMLNIDCRAIEKVCYDQKSKDIKGTKKFSTEIKCNFNLYVANYWININSPNSYNKSHCHPSSFLSGCLYIKVPDKNCGSIIFENPSCDLISSYMEFYYKLSDEYSNLFPLNWVHEPIEGKCLIFPSWLKHSVEPNLSKEDRISISFNVGIS